MDRVLGQAGLARTLGDLVAEHGADRAIGVADLELDADRLAALERRLRELDQPVVERLVEAVVLRLRAVDAA